MDDTSGSAMGTDPWYVYIVRCADQTLYTGIAKDIDARVAQHSAGKGAKYTRSRVPVTLVYRETLQDQGAALKRELAIKRMGTAGKKKLIAAGPPTESLPKPKLQKS